jgi:lipopolysaccharide export system protein LptA
MKRLFLLSLFLVTGGAALSAEAARGSSSTNQVVIDSDGGFEYEASKAIYRDNVRASDSQMDLICELLTVVFETNTTKIDMIVAETNVVILQKDGWAVSDKAIYFAAEDVLVLTGNVILDSPQGHLISSKVIYDRKNNKMSAPGQIRMGGSAGSGLFGTNSLGLGLGLPGTTSPSTNRPPLTSPAKK